MMSQEMMMRPKNDSNAVIITYYVESPAIRSHVQRLKSHHCCKKPETARKSGSDRRSELLAYAKDLRKADSQHVMNPTRKCSRSKPKRWKWRSGPAKFGGLFLQIFHGNKGEWEYRRMASGERAETDPRHGGGRGGVEGGNSRKKKSSERIRSRSDLHFWRRLKSIMKGLAFGCHCNKGWKR